MNVLAPRGQRAALQQGQLCSGTTEEPEAAAPAAQTDIYRNHAVAAGHTHTCELDSSFWTNLLKPGWMFHSRNPFQDQVNLPGLHVLQTEPLQRRHSQTVDLLITQTTGDPPPPPYLIGVLGSDHLI